MRSLGEVIRLLITISSLIHLAASRPVDDQPDLSPRDKQYPLSASENSNSLRHPHDLPDSSPSLFSSVHGLLRNWPAAFAPNGWNIVPGHVPVGTPLYHGRKTAVPLHLVWSGLRRFDPEHAYFFAAHSAGVLHTFVATAPLPVLYFDGISASKNAPGTADLQDIIVFGNDTSQWSDRFPADLVRSQKLCDWVQELGFGGIIRLEAAFELIWCDFSHSVAHVRGVNVTTPISSTGSAVKSITHDDDKYLPSGAKWALSDDSSSNFLGGDWGPIGARSLYWKGFDWRALSAVSTHFVQREPRIILSTRHMVTLYDPKYTSIRDQYTLPNYKRRLLNISAEDISQFKSEVEKAGALWRNAPAFPESPDYASMIDEMVKRKTLEFQQIQQSLDRTNATEAFLYTKVLAYGGFFTYLNGPEALNTGLDAPSVDHQLESLQQSVETCSGALTAHGSGVSSTDESLKSAIGAVQRRICEFEGSVLMDAIEFDLRNDIEDMSTRRAALVHKWRRELEKLLNWLKWPSLITCPGGCEDDQICLVPMWPIDAGGKFNPAWNHAGKLTPKCVGWDLLD